jgi:hypothetical protein
MDHNISYYASVLRELTLARTVFPYSSTIIVFLAVFSVTNIFAWLLLQYSYQSMLHVFQFMILAIRATRMHLHLWQMNRNAHRSGVLVYIPMTEMSSANSTV